jgi:ABC-type nitrate/sulfonate/bicarbonate transport system permease component
MTALTERADPATARTPKSTAENTSRTARTVRSWALPAMTTVGLLVIADIGSRTGILPDVIPPVSDVAVWLFTQAQTVEFWQAMGDTITHWGLGLLVGGGLGILVGIVIGSVGLLHKLFNSTLEFLRPIPAVVYLPLLLLMWGATSRVATILAAVGAFWPLMYQTFYGIKSVDRVTLDTGKMFGLSPIQRLVRLTVPMMLPFVATGVRISASLALIVTVSIEIIGAIPGLGQELQVYATGGIYVGVFGLITAAGILGVLVNVVIERIERRLLHWHPSHRPGEDGK